MFRRFNLVFLVLMCALILPIWASAAVLVDQPLSKVNTFAYYDQEVTPGSEEKNDVYLADDFTNDREWQISKIFVPGDFRFPKGAPSTLLNAAMLHWKIYADDGGKPEGYPRDSATVPEWELSLAPDDSQVSITKGYPRGYPSNTTLTLTTPFRLPPGKYWLVFYPELNWQSYGGFGRQPSDTENGLVTHFIQPRGDATDLPTVWTSADDIDFTDQSGDGYRVPALPQQDFAFRLEGSLYDARISIDPDSLDFGNVNYKEASDPQTLTITNNGGSDLVIGSIDITGTSSGMFEVAPGGLNPCASLTPTIASLGNCTLAVTYTPTTRSAHSASLEITIAGDLAPAILVDLDGTSVFIGTIGSVITLTDADLDFGIKKGKVLIGTAATKIAKEDWGAHAVTFTVKKAIPGETYYDLVVKPPKNNPVQTTLTGAFLMKNPIINTILPEEGAIGTSVRITGQYFGVKKPKVYMEYLKNGKIAKKTCKLTSNDMDNIVFIVPNLPAGNYSLVVEQKKIGLDRTIFEIIGALP